MEKMTDFELELFMKETEEARLLQAPGRMKAEIMAKSQSMSTRAVRQVTRASVKVELMIYGLKTAAAVAVAIFLFCLICHPNLQAAMRQEAVWEHEAAKDDSDRLGQWSETLSDALDWANRKMWQYTGGY